MPKLGDKSSVVTEVQKLLSMLGYDLIIDGYFGDRTDRSLRAFQKKMGLLSDGDAGPKTIEALKAAQKRSAKEDKKQLNPKDYNGLEIETKYALESSQFIKQITNKDKIFIHFTAGGPNAANVIKYWDSDEPRIATAFVIDGESGQIFECFNPNYWSFHLGIKGTNGALDKTSIGIEICAWGPLTKKGDKYFNYVNGEVPESEVCKLNTPFRGFEYFHKYSDLQLKALENLLDYLLEEYNIKMQKNFDMSWFDFNQELIDKKHPGIWTHVNVRKDKSDSYPDKRLLDLLNKLSKKYNG